MRPGTDAQVVVRRGHAQLIEKNLRHGVVVMLAGMDQNRLNLLMLAQLAISGATFIMFGRAPTMLIILKRFLPICSNNPTWYRQMCGISGVLAFKNSNFEVTAAYLARMRDTMVHRGPDGAGSWISPDREWYWRIAAFPSLTSPVPPPSL